MNYIHTLSVSTIFFPSLSHSQDNGLLLIVEWSNYCHVLCLVHGGRCRHPADSCPDRDTGHGALLEPSHSSALRPGRGQSLTDTAMDNIVVHGGDTAQIFF